MPYQAGPSSKSVLGFDRLDQLTERLGVTHRNISQNLAIQFHADQLQSVNELVVGQVMFPGRRSDANDPQAAKIALAGFPVAIAIFQSALHRLLRGAVQLALGKYKSFGALQDLEALGMSFGSAFYSRHFINLSGVGCRVSGAGEKTRPETRYPEPETLCIWQHLAQTALIGVIDRFGLVELAFALAGLGSQYVTRKGVSAHELPLSGCFEPFCRATMGLNLRQCVLLQVLFASVAHTRSQAFTASLYALTLAFEPKS